MSPEPLFQITADIAALNAKMESPDGFTDADLDQLLQLEENFDVKAEDIAKLAKLWRSNGEQKIAFAKEREQTGKAEIAKADRLLAYALKHMEARDIKEAGGPLLTLAVHKNPPFLMMSKQTEENLPEEFIRTKPAERHPDKVAIKKALKEGRKIEGAYLKSTNKIVIK